MAAIKDKLKICYEQSFSSAGLLYVYINGYKENEMMGMALKVALKTNCRNKSLI